jgi:hypothetical protein
LLTTPYYGLNAKAPVPVSGETSTGASV